MRGGQVCMAVGEPISSGREEMRMDMIQIRGLCRETLSNIELSALHSSSDSLERLSHIGSQQAPVSAPRALGLETCMAMSAFYRGTKHPNSEPIACTASTNSLYPES